ncbi:hypothetical protein [Roseateles sp. LKC17W]|uniref:Uncharacterized protein n=1 Tax=Pelomonas margarita TaxID=3299031 RepID=A0ABW7FN84_9BURK
MSTYVEVLVPAQPFTPRLATWLGDVIDLMRTLRQVHALHAERTRLAREAMALRQLAHELESSMPSMAADLRRAADGAF